MYSFSSLGTWKVYWKTNDGQTVTNEVILVHRTFETLSASFLEEALLLTVVWNMARVLANVLQRIHLELSHCAHAGLVEVFKRRIQYFALYLSFGEDRSILTHF